MQRIAGPPLSQGQEQEHGPAAGPKENCTRRPLAWPKLQNVYHCSPPFPTHSPPTARVACHCSIAILQYCCIAARHCSNRPRCKERQHRRRNRSKSTAPRPPPISSNPLPSTARRWDHRSPHCHVHQTDESVILPVSCDGVSPACDEFHAERRLPRLIPCPPASGLAQAAPLGSGRG